MRKSLGQRETKHVLFVVKMVHVFPALQVDRYLIIVHPTMTQISTAQVVLSSFQGGRRCTGARVWSTSLDLDENFKPEHTLFCRELRFVAIYALFFFEIFGHKKCLFG